MNLKRFFPALLFFAPFFLFSQSDSFTTTGKASFYDDKFQGRETSNGEEYDQDDFTAAHRTLPFHSIVHVTNKQNNKSVVVRINDRGPFKKSRIIDLTRSAAKKLDMIPYGVVPVKIQTLTFLDRIDLTDSTLKENEVWDCFSQKVELPDSAIFVWQTESVKHAFYMASDILLSYKLSNVYVKSIRTGNERKFKIFIPLPQVTTDALTLIRTLKKDGFRYTKLIH
ncbi:MAG: septal ring lytic transglycosylase RlpA family protein [Bacteroidota bacterium]